MPAKEKDDGGNEVLRAPTQSTPHFATEMEDASDLVARLSASVGHEHVNDAGVNSKPAKEGLMRARWRDSYARYIEQAANEKTVAKVTNEEVTSDTGLFASDRYNQRFCVCLCISVLTEQLLFYGFMIYAHEESGSDMSAAIRDTSMCAIFVQWPSVASLLLIW